MQLEDDRPTLAEPMQLEDDRPTLAEPGIELGQHLVGSCCDFRSATRLFCVSRWWAALAADDSSWRPLTAVLALEAKLHHTATNGPWRDECRRLFDQRGIFVSECCGGPTPPPPEGVFGINVGVRFRPPGGVADAPATEVVLPLHQRLRLIAAAHGCSLAEARKRLWQPDALAGGRHDPWATATVDDEASKENAHDNATPPSDADDCSPPDDVATSSSPADSAAGLITLGGGQAIVCAPGAGIRAFDFEHSWGAEARQEDVYGSAVAPLVAGCINGRSACVLAYGQTGSGKTYTMSGGSAAADEGVAPRALRALLEAVAAREAMGVRATLRMACVEIFGDKVTDLLHASDGGGGVGGFWTGVAAAATAAGYADVTVDGLSHAVELLTTSEANKRKAATMMNERSSRAHSLLMLTLEQSVGAEPSYTVTSQLCLADLGGCEKVKRSGASGERLAEAININKGLLALKNVVAALNQRQAYIPFHDDQLTMCLRRALSGGAQTYVLLAARPEGEHATETLQALRFGETCAAVEVAAKGGADRQAAAALAALDAQVSKLEQAIIEKERFETYVERRKDERAGLLDAYGAGAALTDFQFEDKKVSRIVGAEKEREQLEKILAARRALLGE